MRSYLPDIVDRIAPRDKPVSDLLSVAHLAGRVFAQGHRRAYKHNAERDPARQRASSGMCKAIPPIASGVGIGLNKDHYNGSCVSLVPGGAGGACLGRDGLTY